MINRRGRGKIFFGWWTVLYTGLISGIGFGFATYGFSVFFKDISAELGLSRAMTSLASGVGALTGGAVSVPSGWLADRLGPKWIIFAGISIGAIGMAAMYFVHSTLAFILVWGILMLTGLYMGLTIAIEQALTNWFIRKRGLAQGIKFALISVGGVIALPTITWLATGQGWRMACVIWGAFLFLISPLTLILVKQKRPEYYGLLPDGARVSPGSSTNTSKMIDRGTEYALDSQETEFTFRQAIRTRAFWVINIANCIYALVGMGFSIHIIPFLTDMGIDKAVASGMTSMMVFLTIPSRFFGGIASDRIGKGSLRFLLAAALAVPVIGIAQFLIHQSTVTIYILLIFYGLSSGLGITLIILIVGRYFGRKAFGSIFGVCNMFQSLAMFLGPIYYGWIYDTTKSYITALTIFAIVAPLCAAAIFLLARAPKLPAAAG